MDQPKWKQFILYLNDVSAVSIYTKDEILQRDLKGIFIGGTTKLVIKFPYLRRSYQSRREVSTILLEALSGTFILALSAMIIAAILGIFNICCQIHAAAP